MNLTKEQLLELKDEWNKHWWGNTLILRYMSSLISMAIELHELKDGNCNTPSATQPSSHEEVFLWKDEDDLYEDALRLRKENSQLKDQVKRAEDLIKIKDESHENLLRSLNLKGDTNG